MLNKPRCKLLLGIGGGYSPMDDTPAKRLVSRFAVHKATSAGMLVVLIISLYIFAYWGARRQRLIDLNHGFSTDATGVVHDFYLDFGSWHGQEGDLAMLFFAPLMRGEIYLREETEIIISDEQRRRQQNDMVRDAEMFWRKCERKHRLEAKSKPAEASRFEP